MSWNESRTIVEAYSRLRNEFSSLADDWLVDGDVVTLLSACYNFKDAGVNLSCQTLNRAMTQSGAVVLGYGLESHPMVNPTGQYRVWRTVKHQQANGNGKEKKKSSASLYYAASEELAPGLPLNKDAWNQLVDKSLHRFPS